MDEEDTKIIIDDDGKDGVTLSVSSGNEGVIFKMSINNSMAKSLGL